MDISEPDGVVELLLTAAVHMQADISRKTKAVVFTCVADSLQHALEVMCPDAEGGDGDDGDGDGEIDSKEKDADAEEDEGGYDRDDEHGHEHLYSSDVLRIRRDASRFIGDVLDTDDVGDFMTILREAIEAPTPAGHDDHLNQAASELERTIGRCHELLFHCKQLDES
jgi:hypothetical protein